ncbi:MAG: pilus assembly protein TadG-related protein [Terriglobales bacterium]
MQPRPAHNSRTSSSRRAGPHRKERGIVIVLVAVVMLFVVGAMAALSIDVVTLYTARSEAQLAADAAALAAARVFANSGVTSDASRRTTRNARTLATTIATQVASQNVVGGRTLNTGEITVTFPNQGDPAFDTNPHVTVAVQRTDLPTFFSRIWGRTANTVGASATAEAYNPSDANALNGTTIPVAPICVKPWLLPNIDPTKNTTNPIFVTSTGAIWTQNPSLVDQGWPGPSNSDGLYAGCLFGDCSGGITPPAAGVYYPGAIDAADFPASTQALPSCSTGFNSYQLAIAGCVPLPITCGANSSINIDTTAYGTTRDADTVAAAECLINYTNAPGTSDSIDTATTRPPLQFVAGTQNQVAGAVGKNVMVSPSLVTIPVINTTTGVSPTNPVQVIGFLQVFLNPLATQALPYGSTSPNEIPATIINMAGCGTGATGQPILGNGASPVAVRLISPP